MKWKELAEKLENYSYQITEHRRGNDEISWNDAIVEDLQILINRAKGE